VIVTTLYAAVGMDTRYPGSLPGVLVVAATGAVAVGLGFESMVVLGGLISVVALAAGIVAWSRSPDARNRRYAFTGIVLGIASFILRWSVWDRYESLIGPFV